MQHFYNLSHNNFVKIKEGRKSIEMRVYDAHRKRLSVGDTIQFFDLDTGETLVREVKFQIYFKNFEELYNTLPKKELGYAPNEKANYRDMYYYYTPEQERKNGVLAIFI